VLRRHAETGALQTGSTCSGHGCNGLRTLWARE
jgi:hypothetical protein